MTTTNQVTSTTTKPKGEIKNLNGKNINSIGQFINAGLIDLSPINYRRHINADSLEELAESIRLEGILQAILVRPKGKRYEVVVGERRFRAAGLSKLAKIPCIVEDLTDDEVRGKQLAENLHRQDPNIFDLARGFAELQNSENLTIAALARRVGKNEIFVTEVLRLNDVIEEAANDYDAGHLPFDLLIEVARYPQESQADVLKLCYHDKWSSSGYVADRESPRKLSEVRKAAEQKVMLNLKHAPFKLDAENLHPEGLSCTNCKQRTDMNGVLFAAHAKIGNCLNPPCFQGKMQMFIQIKREKIAQERTDKNAREFAKAHKAEKKTATAVEAVEAAEAVEGAEAIEAAEQPTAKIVSAGDIPLLNLNYGSGDASKNILAYGAYREIGKNDISCEFAEKAVIIASHRFGTLTKICREPNCETHFPNRAGASAGLSVSGNSTTATDNSKRRQELFDMKIVEPLRLEVFDEAKNAFDADNWTFDNPRWRLLMIFHIYKNEEYKRRSRALELSGIADGEMPSTSERDDDEVFAKIEKIDSGKLSKLLFLLLVMNRGEQSNFSKSLPDMSGVRAVASDFNVNYRLMDAKLRVEKAPKCHQSKAKAYLGKVEAGDTDTPTPNFYAPAVEETVKVVKAATDATETSTVESNTEAKAKPAPKLTLVKSDKSAQKSDETAKLAASSKKTVTASNKSRRGKRARTATATEKLAA